MKKPIKVLIADDHEIVRKGMRALFAIEDSIEVIAEAKNGLEAISKMKTFQPDVILMDIEMPEMDGIAAIEHINKNETNARILVLTSFATDDKIFPALKAGALGYLLKDTSPEDLIRAIHQVFQGEASLHPLIARKMLSEMAAGPSLPLSEDPLTAREVDVIKLIAQGKSNQEIAEQLVLSEATVRTHVSHILAKLHLASRTQAALFALKEGYASLEDFDQN